MCVLDSVHVHHITHRLVDVLDVGRHDDVRRIHLRCHPDQGQVLTLVRVGGFGGPSHVVQDGLEILWVC
jgi:hypothetical protein